MGEGDAASPNHAGDRADAVTHAPALIAGVVADGRVGETAVARNRSQSGDEGNEREIERGKSAALNQLDKNVFDVVTVAFAVAVEVTPFDGLAIGVFLPVVRLAVAVGIDRRQEGFDDVEMAVAIPIFTRIQHAVAVFVFAALNGNVADLQKAAPDRGPGGGSSEQQP